MKMLRFSICLVVGLIGTFILGPYDLDIMIYDSYYVIGCVVLWVIMGLFWFVKK